ncbi:cytochrome b5-like heme/steroid binding domain containing protein [Nitzschia inconspicua]|uniref:Cytochrome b5-like heme/steroid binding domain containing protein n=1 Tax=Nitzschia inconspicua TaxID=303405 RepID=A0A9K3LLP0_9STRA|nr:cytochrome b5-like heme/steroid binding domain containing protein [Nitzschia inconspicua]
MSSLLSSYMEDWEGFYQYLSEYGFHITLWAVLSAVTIYRREMSVNRFYHEDDELVQDGQREYNNNPEILSSSPASHSSACLPTSPESRRISELRDEEQEIETEELLEGAAMYSSPLKPMLNLASLASLWMDSFPGDDEEPSLKMMKTDMTATDLLERVGSYASGEPIAAAIAVFCPAKRTKVVAGQPLPLAVDVGLDPFTKNLPPDVHVHIVSFLHPRDVVKLPCVSKKYRNIIDDPNNLTCSSVWQTLWKRDYEWIVKDWDIGRLAFQRSNVTQWAYNKDFYFRFGQAYLNYVLAGMNTHDHCLAGIHGNIYDLTSFLHIHPGSPDTLMVHSGRDATAFFEDMGHSNGARRMAMSLCVVVDKATENDESFGLFPTAHTIVNDESRIRPRLPDGADNLLLLGRIHSRVNRTGTLLRIRKEFKAETEHVQARVASRFANDPTVLGREVNTYFDPFTGQWRLWYTESNTLTTIFVPA